MKLDAASKKELAARFVLGSMHGAARRRFVKMIAADQALRIEVEGWHNGFLPWTRQVASVPPPPELWQKLESRLGFSESVNVVRAAGLRIWQGLTTAMTTAVLVLAVLLYQGTPVPETQTLVLVLSDQQSQSGWVFTANQARLTGAALQPRGITSAQDYELWVLPPGMAPQSLGLLGRSGRSQLLLAEAVSQWIKPGATLAVSLEPLGGSPTGAPTGPVLYTGEALRL